ncbi:SDR family NAD(P)-dependent oxidoreductase [Streptomyces sp. NPDC056190]|uniref:SDR family NAD(P)-dependent oxidoreductase n=1 Tax=Streptomyces sp. NPDC056190 TaxID=3345741 RepID=UPI0035E305FB
MKKVAVVTGAANGIGAATARLLVKDGYDVVGLDREPGDIEGVTFIKFDVTNVEEHDALLGRIESEHGPIAALANVAGAYAYTTMADMTVEEFRKQLAVFLEGAVLLSRAAGMRMMKRGGGRIVNVTSTASTAAMPNSLAYNTAKGGLDAASRSLALELAPHGVLLNLVAPGFVRTRMSNDPESGVNEADTDWFQTDFVDNGRLPIGRTSEPEEIAAPIAFLLSDRNTYISGTTLMVDGGSTSSI